MLDILQIKSFKDKTFLSQIRVKDSTFFDKIFGLIV